MYRDFNEILYSFEKKCGIPQDEGLMKVFWNVLSNFQLEDVGYERSWFTWKWGNFAKTILKKGWIGGYKCRVVGRFSTFLLRNLPSSLFDHYPLLINIL